MALIVCWFSATYLDRAYTVSQNFVPDVLIIGYLVVIIKNL